MSPPTVSVVICTHNRADALEKALDALRYQTYPHFEVVVVVGPCTDRTGEVMEAFADRVRGLDIPERNVSKARNLGIRSAQGDLLAFIDDDSVPDPLWLQELVRGLDDPEVGAVGGPVLDDTGCRLQWRYAIVDRWGDAETGTEHRRLGHLDHPDSWRVPFAVGTNSLYRRDLLVRLGGFDEHFTFYLEEPDLAVRLVDRGYRVHTHDRGVVQHKFLASQIRNRAKITVDRSDVIRSRLYFAARHGLPRSDVIEMWVTNVRFITAHRADLAGHAEEGRIPREALARFHRDAVAGESAAREWAAQPPATRPTEWFGSEPGTFQPFERLHPSDSWRRTCLVDRVGHDRVQPGAGEILHVITEASGDDCSADLEDGVWVHRLPVDETERWPQRVYAELLRIDDIMPIDTVRLLGPEADELSGLVGPRFTTSTGAGRP